MTSQFDPKAPSIVAQALREIWDELKKLIDSKIILTQGVTIFHNDCEMEYVLNLNIGPSLSRADQIEKLLQSFVHLTSTLEGVITIWGHGLMNGENLKELEIITQKGSSATINFGELVRQVKSELVVIGIRKKIPTELRDAIVSVNISKNALLVDGNKEATFSVGLDYANLWHNQFQSFRVKDVLFTYNLELVEGSLEPWIPESLKARIRKATEALRRGNSQASQFFNIVSKEFLAIESEEIVREIKQMIKVNPSDRLEVLEVIPTMQSFQVSGTDFPITLPGKIGMKFRTGIEENEIVVKGKLTLDMKKFSKVIGEIAKRIETKTKAYDF